MADYPSPISQSSTRRATSSVSRQWVIGNRRPSAFTFVEVLFAIIILGIGMIMIAGILPVAIKQQSDTRDEMTAKAVCESGFAFLSTIARTNPDAFVPTNLSDGNTSTQQLNFTRIVALRSLLNTGIAGSADRDEERAGKVIPFNYDVTSFRPPMVGSTPTTPSPFLPFDAIAGSRASSTDPRYQYMGFYRRDENASSLRLIIVAMKLQNTDEVKEYSFGTMAQETINGNNGPFLCEVEIKNQLLEPDRVFFTSPPAAPVLAEGAFVIIADSRASSDNTDRGRAFRNNGRVFQLGQQRLDLDSTGMTWDLASGYDLDVASVGPDGLQNTADDAIDGSMDSAGTYTVNGTNVSGTSAQAWVIGRGLYNPSGVAGPSNKYLGRAQDVGVLIADVPLR